MATLPKAKDIVITPITGSTHKSGSFGNNNANTEPVIPREDDEFNPQQGPSDEIIEQTKPANDNGGNGNAGITLNPSGYSPSGYNVSPYDPSTNKAYQEAMAKLNQAYANNPTYTPSYDDEIQRLYNEIVNRGKFNYDLLSDPLYQQYREQYVNQGNMAMMDAMGQAAALTGGYGSTYSQAVGQQQYNAYLNQLNQMVPEFYDRAFNYWQAQGQDLYNQYGLVADMRDTEYGRYRDDVSDYWNNVNYLAGRADTYYNQGAENYWNTQSMNQQNYWNEQNMNFENYWNTLNYELSAYNATKTKSDNGSDADNIKVESAFKQATGNNRFEGNGKLFTTKEYNEFVKEVGMNRTKNGMCTTIADAYVEGKITEAQANELLGRYNITDEEFAKFTGMA